MADFASAKRSSDANRYASSSRIHKIGSARMIDVLRPVALFREVSEEQLAVIAGACQSFTTYPGQTLLEEGEVGTDIFLIQTGRVSIHLESIAPAVEVGIARLGPGETIGEMAMVDGQEHAATVVALDRCEILRIPLAPLRELLEQDVALRATIMRNVAVVLSARLRRMNRRLLNLMRMQPPR